jgi:cytidine deaminase
MEGHELVKAAIKAKENAYVPYSNFRVGAAVLTKSGKLYTGCNIENASYGATNCAERTAIFKAVSEGEKELAAIAVNGDSEHFTFPCGICRQVMAEFSKDMKVYISNKYGQYKEFTLDQLIPGAFTDKDMK